MLKAHHWERHLLNLAHEALDSGTNAHAHLLSDPTRWAQAVERCEAITRENSKTFFMASSLLPGEKRLATQALYAFCRVSDDLVDRPQDSVDEHARAADLAAWRQQVLYGAAPSGVHSAEGEVAAAWAQARRRYLIPSGYVSQLLDGLALDLHQTRYDTFADLAKYCYGVACTVGLMSMHITGYASRAAIPYAIRLGVALQLTNILRDVGEDWRGGRLYLPREELQAFQLDESDIAAGVENGRYDDRWRKFMRFQIQRARTLYTDAMPGVNMLHRDGRFAIAAAGELYRAILNQIEASDYDVFTRRASVSAWGKLSRLPGIWWRSTVSAYAA